MKKEYIVGVFASADSKVRYFSGFGNLDEAFYTTNFSEAAEFPFEQAVEMVAKGEGFIKAWEVTRSADGLTPTGVEISFNNEKLPIFD
ncbi:hypothetical protein [Paenibacillus sp. 1P03SA]|uniref:hypothetical protein n=1 Tax=Paenibacillus sp. 1P03SA TaxID=3132294 RepID=UPI0039A1D2CE